MRCLSFSLNSWSQTEHWKFSRVWNIYKEPVHSFPWGSGREDKASPQKDASLVFVQSLSCPALFNPMSCSTPGFPVLHYLLEFAHTHVYWVSDAIQPSYPLLLPSPSALNLPQHQGLFQWVSSSHQVAKYWSFIFSISSSNVYSGLISFRIYSFHLLAAHGTLKNLPQHHSSKASILWHWSFFMVQLSHPYMTTGKTIAFTIQNFVSEVMSLSLHMLIVFLPRSKCLNFMVAVAVLSDFGAQENKICHCFYFFPIYLPWNDGTGCRREINEKKNQMQNEISLQGDDRHMIFSWGIK